MYRFTTSTLRYGARRLAWGAALLLVGLVMSLVWIPFFIGVAGVLLFAVGAFVSAAALWHVVSRGRWEIVVDDERVLWSSPRGLGASFEWPLAEVARLERRRRVKQADEVAAYHLVRTSGEVRELLPAGGVDLGALTSALRAGGVEVVDRRVL